MTRASCEEIREVIPEVALGIASGDERARVLRHVSACAGCRGDLERLSALADHLMLIAPTHEPPVGFEARVLQKITRLSEPASNSFLRLAIAAAAALVVASAGAGLTLWATAEDRRLADSYRTTLAAADGRYFAAVPLRSAEGDGAAVVFAYAGDPSWVFITIEDPALEGSYEVKVLTTAGRSVSVGEADLDSTAGGWGAAIDVDVHDVDRFVLVRSDGLRLAGGFDRD